MFGFKPFVLDTYIHPTAVICLPIAYVDSRELFPFLLLKQQSFRSLYSWLSLVPAPRLLFALANVLHLIALVEAFTALWRFACCAGTAAAIMCIALFSTAHPDYALIMINNRDVRRMTHWPSIS